LKIPLEILKLTNPDGTSSFKAIISLQDAIANTSRSQKLVQIQNEYGRFIDSCQSLLKGIWSAHRNKADSQLQWELADKIYSFIKRIENDGYVFANVSDALSRDVGMSKSQLNYLLKFRTYYPSLDQVSKEINWSKYRELMDFPDQKSRKQCEALIKAGKIQSDTEIREFKRKLKTSKIP